MGVAKVILFGLLLQLVHCVSEGAIDDKEDHRITLNTDNFRSSISEGNWLVEFYAPWCGHCRNLAPVWKDLAYELHEENSPVKVAIVDADEHKQIAQLINLQGFPTIFYFVDGVRYAFPGGQRTVESFKEFITTGWKEAAPEHFQPPKIGWLGENNFVEVLRKHDKILVEVLSNSGVDKDSPLRSELKYLVGTLPIFRLNCLYDPEFCASIPIDPASIQDNKPHLYKIYADQQKIFQFEGIYNKKDLLDFVKDKDYPSSWDIELLKKRVLTPSEAHVKTLTPETFFDSLKEGEWFVILHSTKCPHSRSFKTVVQELAELMQDEPWAQVAELNCKQNSGATEFCESFGVNSFPTSWFVKSERYRKYEGPRSAEFIRKFFTNIHNRSLGDIGQFKSLSVLAKQAVIPPEEQPEEGSAERIENPYIETPEEIFGTA